MRGSLPDKRQRIELEDDKLNKQGKEQDHQQPLGLTEHPFFRLELGTKRLDLFFAGMLHVIGQIADPVTVSLLPENILRRRN